MRIAKGGKKAQSHTQQQVVSGRSVPGAGVGLRGAHALEHQRRSREKELGGGRADVLAAHQPRLASAWNKRVPRNHAAEQLGKFWPQSVYQLGPRMYVDWTRERRMPQLPA